MLVVMSDMTSYCEAVREVSAATAGDPGAAGLPRVPVQRPGLAVRALRPGPRSGRVGDHHPGADHAGRRHHPPRSGPDRVHHRRAGGALRRAARPRGVPAGGRAVLAVPADAARGRAGADPGGPPRGRRPGDLGPGPGPADRRAGGARGRGRAEPHRPQLPGLPAHASRTGCSARARTEARGLEETLGLAWQALAVLPRRELSMLSTGADREVPPGATRTRHEPARRHRARGAAAAEAPAGGGAARCRRCSSASSG